MNPQKRGRSSSLSSLSSTGSALVPATAKKRAKVETRECPICKEHIPLRLLAKHSDFEFQRVEKIIQSVGSTDVLAAEFEEGSSTSFLRRKSAVRAQKSFQSKDTDVQTTKILQKIRRNRKRRHAGLKEMTREDEESYLHASRRGRQSCGEIVCPVCLTTVTGDEDVLDAHVDACLAGEARRMDEEREQKEMLRREEEEDEWEDEGPIIGSVRGTGFHTRNRNEQDIEEDIDIDGDDEAFGCPQFTEGDILGPAPAPEIEVDVDIENEGHGSVATTLRDLVAEGKVTKGKEKIHGGLDAVKAKMDEVMGVGEADRMDRAILTARHSSNRPALIKALEEKVTFLEATRVSSSTSLLCRICLDPYNEPTVSTGCWHTCCRECWLRCLGSTKLCPICKRITGATDLRRVYL
ncbi:uncharacterized protein BT62DRAFT_966570 [Guyanagaster necrorhizus]|uniref:RING-type domain-containing protein n=1 Tax=Guyanagaster necrorhizus TaxID=856835 RepID=A0A9P8ATU3_9AGAR|nr:uncharacterized protein BT62DRAFT_966570 [Guyanagaster necrorhizus MCA 3950]KAG7447575.1 hypothetical protein BT62DRAFT_966570 [Guyanagaster necrorhizus MCA 3950]